ncbi:MAG: tRNA dihydrouridine synthase DusB [Bacteroidales bacterium]|nr:tRNA dihydrouridine synthase DusB [Bacteroidales bacterium]
MARIGNTNVGTFPLFLAPMEDITDSSFRSICKSFGADVLITEFISADGLIRDAWNSRIKMQFEEVQRPIGIQIFGSNVDSMKQAVQMAETANPDFIDLNFGCPVRKIVMKGGGSALMQDIPKMISMAEAVVKTTRLPVTVKTRLGWDETHREIVDIAERLQDAGISAIGIHGRTRSQQYSGKADWTLIGEVKNNPHMKIPVWGNGDVDSGMKAEEMKNRYGIDGIMIGRAAMGNPWIFNEIKSWLERHEELPPPSVKQRIDVLRDHIQKSIAVKGERSALLELRRLYAGYFKGIPDFKKYRMRLVTAIDFGEVEMILSEITIL